jgi:hypothetical protein
VERGREEEASSKFESPVNRPGKRAERGDMSQICCNLRHIFFVMDEFAKKPEEADGSEGVWVTQTEGSTECIGETLPLTMNERFLLVYLEGISSVFLQ